MSRYIRLRSRLIVEDEVVSDEQALTPDLVVTDRGATDTGLLWADGSPVWRAPNPIGFGVAFDES